MQIEFIKTACGPDSSLNGSPGEIKDVPTDYGKALIADGAAKPADPTKVRQAKTAAAPKGKIEKRG